MKTCATTKIFVSMTIMQGDAQRKTETTHVALVLVQRFR